MAKPFLTYQQQLDKLVREKNLVITDRAYAETRLKLISYYALISGYKNPYRNPTTKKYKDGTTFEEIVALYQFDENLREIFLKYLLKIERHLRSLLSYYFTEMYGEGQAEYLKADNYSHNPRFRKGISILIQKLAQAANSTESPYIRYQRTTYGNVPLWVLVNTLSFGSLSKMYQFIPSSLQNKIRMDFQTVSEKELEQYLRVLTKYRNVCAHSERLFSYKSVDNIPDTPLHEKLHIPRKGAQYLYGKGDLFSVVIGFRYLLQKEEFGKFKESLVKIISHFAAQTQHVSPAEILHLMGFPQNWKKISTYRIPPPFPNV
ncbi:MAG: Abi family protein [Oscillospiraceae bacterium]